LQIVGRNLCGTVPASGWHFQTIEPSFEEAIGEKTNVLPLSLALARCGEALEYVAMIKPEVTLICPMNFPWMEVGERKPADLLFLGMRPVLEI